MYVGAARARRTTAHRPSSLMSDVSALFGSSDDASGGLFGSTAQPATQSELFGSSGQGDASTVQTQAPPAPVQESPWTVGYTPEGYQCALCQSRRPAPPPYTPPSVARPCSAHLPPPWCTHLNRVHRLVQLRHGRVFMVSASGCEWRSGRGIRHCAGTGLCVQRQLNWPRCAPADR